MTGVTGLHHVTAIAGDPGENLEFYTEILGLRLVKRSVNQDAPDTYHLFYADGEGRPGTDLTFFPWPAMSPGRAGVGLALEVGFSVSPGSLGWWSEWLEGANVDVGEPERRFGAETLSLRDPHGLSLALVETDDPLDTAPWKHGPVPESRRLRGFHAVRLWERELAPTARFLVDGLGFREEAADGGWHRFEVAEGGPSRRIEVRELPGERRGARGTGSVHHVAFRAPDEQAQAELRERVIAADGRPTDFIDRFWFRSIYFKEPGGTLFEIATDGPGFTVDEDADELGETLILPPWLEARREEIEAELPPLEA